MLVCLIGGLPALQQVDGLRLDRCYKRPEVGVLGGTGLDLGREASIQFMVYFVDGIIGF